VIDYEINPASNSPHPPNLVLPAAIMGDFRKQPERLLTPHTRSVHPTNPQGSGPMALQLGAMRPEPVALTAETVIISPKELGQVS